jgi:hypothetical protein
MGLLLVLLVLLIARSASHRHTVGEVIHWVGQTGAAMGDLEKILVTWVLTLMSGIILLVIGQIIIRAVIEPVYDQRKAVGEVADVLIYHGREWGNPGFDTMEEKADFDKAQEAIRQKASLLRVRTYAIPKYSWLVAVGMVPKHEDVLAASRELMGLSNSLHRRPSDRLEDRNYERVEKIKKYLGLPEQL